MAVSNQTVVITVVVKGANAQQVMGNVGATSSQAAGQINQASTAASNASKTFSSWASTMATLKKALISGLGMLVAFNVFVTLPEKIIEGIVAAFSAGIEVLAEFQERVLGLTAIIASSNQYMSDLGENYAYSGKIALSVMDEFLRRGRETLATTAELALVYQNVLVSGGRFVKTHQEAVDVTILLANAIAAVTTGQEASRQLASEVRDLFTQQNRASSQLNRFLFASTTEMRQFWEEADRSGNAVEMLHAKLSGFVKAALDMGQLMRGIKSSFVDLGTLLARYAFSGILGDSLEYLGRIQIALAEDTALLQRVSAVISASLRALFKGIAGVFGVTLPGVGTLLSTIEVWMPKVVGWVVKMVGHVKEFFLILKAVLPIFVPIITLIITNLDTVAKLLAGIGNIIGGIANLIYEGIAGLLTMNLSRVEKAWEDFKTSQAEGWTKLITGIGDAVAGTAKTLAGVLKSFADLKNLQSGTAAGAQAEADAYENVAAELKEIQKLESDRNLLNEKLQARHIPIDVTALLKPVNQEMATTNAIIRTIGRQSEVLQYALNGIFTDKDMMRGMGGFIENLDKVRAQVQPITDLIKMLQNILPEVIEDYGETHVETEKVRTTIEQLYGVLAQLGSTVARTREDFAAIFNTRMDDIMGSMRNKVGAMAVEDFERAATLDRMLKVQTKISFEIGKQSQEYKTISEGVEKLKGEMVKASNIYTLKGFFGSLKDYLSDPQNAMQLFAAVGNQMADAMQNFFSALFFGGDKLKGFRDFIGDIIIMIGQMMFSLGTAALLISIFMRGYAEAMGITAGGGAALMAAGAGAIALGTLIKGGGGAASTTSGAGASGGGGGSSSQTIYMEPYFQRNNDTLDRMEVTLNSLDATLGAFSTKPAGVLVKEGAGGAGGPLAKSVINEIRANPKERMKLQSAMFNGR